METVFDEVDLKLASANSWRDSHFPGFPGSSPGHTAQDVIGLFCCQDVRLAHAQLWKHNRVTSLVATFHSPLVWSNSSLVCKPTLENRTASQEASVWVHRKKMEVHLTAELEATQWEWGGHVSESTANWRGTGRSVALEPQVRQGL